jgi:hypothetical protein
MRVITLYHISALSTSSWTSYGSPYSVFSFNPPSNQTLTFTGIVVVINFSSGKGLYVTDTLSKESEGTHTSVQE